ncbi:ComEC/Rec2 family competence protein, partial [Patescibacteria group bacterium]|nr:ComEC/Rec2 family competence protein [Patescibacteria group bacterium]
MSGTKFFLLVCLILIIGILIGLVFRTSRFFESEFLEFDGQVIEINGEVIKQEENKFVLKKQRENVLIFSSQVFDYKDKLKVIGKIEKPPVFDDFDYREYLERERIFFLMYEPEIEKISEKRFSIYKNILNLRKNLSEAINKSYITEQASILKAMTLGIKTEISDNLKDKLNRAGIRHLTAISGMHTIILINALMILFLSLGLWRRQAF